MSALQFDEIAAQKQAQSASGLARGADGRGSPIEFEQICELIGRHPEAGITDRNFDDIFSRCRKQGGVWMLSEADEFCYLLSRIRLEGAIETRHETRLQELAGTLGSVAVRKILGRLFDDAGQQEILSAVADGKWNMALQQSRPPLSRLNFWRSPLECLQYWFLQLRSVLLRRLHPCGVMIVILGPDGAGKSTMTGQIAEFFSPLFTGSRNIMWRPQVLMPSPKIEVPSFDPPHTKPAHGALRSHELR